MKRCIGILCPLVMIFLFTSFELDTHQVAGTQVPESLQIQDTLEAYLPQPPQPLSASMVSPPYVGTSFIGFREALAFKESGGDYFTTNTLGYLGKYQFGIGTLQLIGVYNATQFLQTPELQEKAFAGNLSRNKWILRREIPRFVGHHVKGVEITESGILAAAHLAGAGNVKKYLYSSGSLDVVDAYGTSITQYLRKFKGYDTSGIQAVRNPKVLL